MGSEGGELGGTSSWGQHIVSSSDECSSTYQHVL